MVPRTCAKASACAADPAAASGRHVSRGDASPHGPTLRPAPRAADAPPHPPRRGWVGGVASGAAQALRARRAVAALSPAGGARRTCAGRICRRASPPSFLPPRATQRPSRAACHLPPSARTEPPPVGDLSAAGWAPPDRPQVSTTWPAARTTTPTSCGTMRTRILPSWAGRRCVSVGVAGGRRPAAVARPCCSLGPRHWPTGRHCPPMSMPACPCTARPRRRPEGHSGTQRASPPLCPPPAAGARPRGAPARGAPACGPGHHQPPHAHPGDSGAPPPLPPLPPCPIALPASCSRAGLD
jgi:hypothetical protein